jgi:hypothetical protein
MRCKMHQLPQPRESCARQLHEQDCECPQAAASQHAMHVPSARQYSSHRCQARSFVAGSVPQRGRPTIPTPKQWQCQMPLMPPATSAPQCALLSRPVCATRTRTTVKNTRSRIRAMVSTRRAHDHRKLSATGARIHNVGPPLLRAC